MKLRLGDRFILRESDTFGDLAGTVEVTRIHGDAIKLEDQYGDTQFVQLDDFVRAADSDLLVPVRRVEPVDTGGYL